ncbi:MAG: ABC transporter ATP-binding protein [Thermodesulfobacteriota bacterium]|nr:ABC transporter ATP-binding protein [Thermodesulfobacteriota bacterium]
MLVSLRNITKKFGPLKAVDDVSISIGEGDFFTLLGPSGCGKTTLLRTVAGFYRPDAGDIYFGETRINDIPAHKRETGMVFQNYALFPHMSVFDNIAYGLRAKKLPSREIRTKVKEILKRIQLEEYSDRSPSQLSGGQQQRVALARALVISPQVLLMDEPLSNLDAKLRVSMREEIKKMQKELGITTIYVTHDQEEAMAVSDRIAIINLGRLEQIGAPFDIYMQPKNRFVAGFIGNSNVIEAYVNHYDAGESMLHAEINGKKIFVKTDRPRTVHDKVSMSLRPEWIRIVKDNPTDDINVLSGTVTGVTFLGSIIRYRILYSDEQVITIDVHDPRDTDINKEGDIINFQFGLDSPVIIEE